MGYIYSITNKINFKRYIGQTLNKNVHDRWKQHFKKESNCRYLKYALLKYGKDSFHFEIVFTCENKDLDYYEKYYMEKFNTLVPYGYNLREAGNHGNHNEETKNKIKNSLKEYYARLSPEEKKVYSERNKGSKNHNFGKKMPEEQKLRMIKNIKTKKPVECYNSQNELITTYESASAAARSFGAKNSSHISHCCLGYCKTAYGFYWKFAK